MQASHSTSVRLERSRETLAQSRLTGFSTSLETNGTETGNANPKRAELASAAKAFEAVFLRQMIGSMRQASLAQDDLLGGGRAAEQFRDMQDAKLADNMAETGGFGVAEMLLKQFEGAAKLAAGTPQDIKPAAGGER